MVDMISVVLKELCYACDDKQTKHEPLEVFLLLFNLNELVCVALHENNNVISIPFTDSSQF